jgi:hypothetical protein
MITFTCNKCGEYGKEQEKDPTSSFVVYLARRPCWLT